MESLTIRWEGCAGEPARTTYLVNDTAVGEDDSGFDRVLEIIRSQQDAKVILKIVSISSFGGKSLIDTLPFSNRFEEFRSSVGAKGYVYEFF
jgi:hypothetical protein